MSHPAIVKWCQQFEDGRTDLTDAERQGRRTTVSTSGMVLRVEGIILSNRHTHGTGVGNIRCQCSFHRPSPTGLFKLCSGWVPYSLTFEHKGARFVTFLELLRRYSAEGNDFLSRMVTGDETWVQHFTPGTKQASMAWRHTSSPVRTKYKVPPSAGKVMANVFFPITKELSTPSLCGRAQPLMLSRTANH
ncbi:hypothetical protein AVEN_68373-1 [Araneus ventricosus]|uniref:Uncharacterized protein n=1 Tax=Araneus ventricosus TaxID=182803 RepID=A0A4Y2G0A4_ARAVE|nr:hypothetical protein AVEN_68373-1 [Araneus ventricosus]